MNNENQCTLTQMHDKWLSSIQIPSAPECCNSVIPLQRLHGAMQRYQHSRGTRPHPFSRQVMSNQKSISLTMNTPVKLRISSRCVTLVILKINTIISGSLLPDSYYQGQNHEKRNSVFVNRQVTTACTLATTCISVT